MSSLCLSAGAMVVSLSWQAFTISWTHSVEQVEWQEDYRVAGRHLELSAARIKGSGAGMDVPPGAVHAAGMYHYWPKRPPIESLNLARSEGRKDYGICWELGCMTLSSLLPGAPKDSTVEIYSCAARP
ncbi:MAG: DUF1850 domain-containing protein [Alphaproteobacteria bacterium]|nr:DUF1850 domain-containing protein [Alphaproteobacteria bacterium]MCW5752766.1 DUF1850 domain-containing protein [Alphaproteobacteria bacterium]